MASMDEWNKLVDKHWDYWEYYKDLYDFALSKGANNFMSKLIYPIFYQERLLKREFVDNMQLLGELKPEEIRDFEVLVEKPLLHNVYNYYKKPTGGYYGYFNTGLFIFSLTLPLMAYKGNKSISWYIMPPLLFNVFGTLAGWNYLRLNLPHIVDMSQWAIEQRKAKVWLEERNLPTAKLASTPELKQQILSLITAKKQ